jgi:hypothetical protein
MVGNFIRDSFKALVSRKYALPNDLFFIAIKMGEIMRRIDRLKLLYATSEDLMCKIEEDLGENHQMPMIKGKVKISMFAASRMRINQHIMETLRYIIFRRSFDIS